MRYYLAIDIGASSGRHIARLSVDPENLVVMHTHLPRINTIRDEEMVELAEFFKVKYRKDFLNL